MRCQGCLVNEGLYKCDGCGKYLCKSCLFWDAWAMSCASREPGWYCAGCQAEIIEGNAKK